MLSLSLALPPLPLPLCSASLIFTLLLLEASHGDHPHHRVLVELALQIEYRALLCVALSALDRANTNVLLKCVGWWQQFRISLSLLSSQY